MYHKRYENAKPVGHVSSQPCNDQDHSAAPEPSAYLMEAPWFACPNCGFPLRCGFLECPVCECLFLFKGESEPSQTIPKVMATLKAYAGPARGEREVGAGPSSSAAGAAGRSIIEKAPFRLR